MSPRRRLETTFDLSSARRCHVVGVGGPGMSPIALVLKGNGHVVSGSDTQQSPVVDSLRAAGVKVSIGHAAANVTGADIVTYSTAIPSDNPELLAARGAGTVVCHRSEVLAALCTATESIAVAGTHGKTTTSALLAHILVATGRDPSCIIGGTVPEFGSGARVGTGGVLVLEADESDGTLDVLSPAHLVVTNIDVDHLDYFGSFSEVQESFVDAALRTRGFVVVNADDANSAPVLSATAGLPTAVTFGRAGTADMRLSDFAPTANGGSFDLEFRGQRQRFDTPLRGVHNAMNCAAAVAMACLHGVTLAESASAVGTFGGVRRRFTERGVHRDVMFVDDYAHLPAEIEAALDSARSHPDLNGRVIAVFQPNRFHRIAVMADSYAHCFGAADLVVITDVYASGTDPIDGVTGELVVSAVRSAHPDRPVVWAPHREDVVREVVSYMQPGDVCVSMGCGDIETFPDDLAAAVS